MMGYGRGYTYGDMMGSWESGLLMFVIGVFSIAAIVLLIVWAVRAAGGHHGTMTGPQQHGRIGHDEAVAIAKRRLASGEITAEEYNRIISALGG